MDSPRTCQHCNAHLSPFVRSDARYCSTRCRVAAHRVHHAGASPLPAALRDCARWVRHDAAKRPLTVHGHGASSTNARTWTTYAAAHASSVGNGLGFVLDGSDGVICLDLDHCLDRGRLAPWAADLLASCPDTYTEVSPSGQGLHVWGTGELDRGRIVNVNGGKVEMYGRSRYITITENPFAGAPSHLADLSAVTSSLRGAAPLPFSSAAPWGSLRSPRLRSCVHDMDYR